MTQTELYEACSPIIFLDFDGVLNCEIFYQKQHFEGYKDAKKELKKLVKSKKIERLEYYKSQICPERIVWLNNLCTEMKAKVVISASMRSGKSIEDLQEIFTFCGGTFEIISKTEKLGYERGVEISKWLKDNISIDTHGVYFGDFKKYVIIDDDSDMLISQQNHFFQTDNYSGLTPTICYKIVNFLNT